MKFGGNPYPKQQIKTLKSSGELKLNLVSPNVVIIVSCSHVQSSSISFRDIDWAITKIYMIQLNNINHHIKVILSISYKQLTSLVIETTYEDEIWYIGNYNLEYFKNDFY